MMDESIKEIIVDKLTKLLIEQDFEDKKKGKVSYISKINAYKDLILLFKKYF